MKLKKKKEFIGINPSINRDKMSFAIASSSGGLFCSLVQSLNSYWTSLPSLQVFILYPRFKPNINRKVVGMIVSSPGARFWVGREIPTTNGTSVFTGTWESTKKLSCKLKDSPAPR